MARTSRIADDTPRAADRPQFLDVTIPGSLNAQVARVIASYNDRHERIAIVFPSPTPSLDRAAVVTAVRARLGDFHLAYVDSNQVGVVHLWMPDVSRSELALLTAAAAAVLQYSWGWDESPSITVSAGDEAFRFRIQYNDDGTYEAIEQTAA